MRNEITESYLKLDYPSFNEVKLIIGNGFDLACGLQSSFDAFFKASKNLYKEIEEWTMDKKKSYPEKASTWDLIFYFLKDSETKFKNPEDVDWTDVEAVMRIVLGFSTRKTKMNFYLSNVMKAFVEDYTLSSPQEQYLYRQLAYRSYSSADEFYRELLMELMKFEQRFSNFIKEQMTPSYQQKARNMLLDGKHLNIPRTRLCSIDTFNYSTPDVFYELLQEDPSKNQWFTIRHVNGRIGGPIFGIDSHDIKIEDPRYIFTKTYRKMVRLAKGEREPFNRRFSNVVIYGHSLSEADYSYFFSIMNHLNLDDYSKETSRIIVAFSDFTDTADEITAWNTLKLLDAYDNWKNPNSNRHGLVETMETSDRIGFVKIKTDDL